MHNLLFRKVIFVILFLSIFSSIPKSIFAQASDYEVKSFLLWKISDYIEWPRTANMDDKSKPFIIAVLGKNPFGNLLDDLYSTGGQKIKNKNVVIRYYKNVEEIDRCHILFISESEKKRLKDILSYTKTKPILTIGDTEEFGEKGVHINFYIAKNKTRFKLNELSVENDGFKVDFRLRNIAKIISSTKGDKQ